MESKQAEVQKAAPEKEAAAAAGCYRKTVGEEATFMESSKDLLRQFKDKPAGEHWVCLKNKVRAAGEYASLRTRQGISMFGEPKLQSYIKDGAEDEPKKMASTTEI